MDTLQHAYAPVLATYAWSGGEMTPAIVAGIVAAMPDVIEWLEKELRKEPSSWLFYEMLHSSTAAIVSTVMGVIVLLSANAGAGYLCIIFFGYTLHLLLDWPTHGDGKRWYVLGERFLWEALAWGILIALATFVNGWFVLIGGMTLLVATAIIMGKGIWGMSDSQ